MSFVDEVYRKVRPDTLTGAHSLGGSGGRDRSAVGRNMPSGGQGGRSVAP
uniref:Uncharacterized protein n=1 Tax=Streptomyces rochei TaxID=1928 RepID=A0A0U3TZ13_STRRO|nr:hypothetical protein [Streptomyces rochei]